MASQKNWLLVELVKVCNTPILSSGIAIEDGHRNSGFTMIYPLKMVIVYHNVKLPEGTIRPMFLCQTRPIASWVPGSGRHAFVSPKSLPFPFPSSSTLKGSADTRWHNMNIIWQNMVIYIYMAIWRVEACWCRESIIIIHYLSVSCELAVSSVCCKRLRQQSKNAKHKLYSFCSGCALANRICATQVCGSTSLFGDLLGCF